MDVFCAGQQKAAKYIDFFLPPFFKDHLVIFLNFQQVYFHVNTQSSCTQHSAAWHIRPVAFAITGHS